MIKARDLRVVRLAFVLVAMLLLGVRMKMAQAQGASPSPSPAATTPVTKKETVPPHTHPPQSSDRSVFDLLPLLAIITSVGAMGYTWLVAQRARSINQLALESYTSPSARPYESGLDHGQLRQLEQELNGTRALLDDARKSLAETNERIRLLEGQRELIGRLSAQVEGSLQLRLFVDGLSHFCHLAEEQYLHTDPGLRARSLALVSMKNTAESVRGFQSSFQATSTFLQQRVPPGQSSSGTAAVLNRYFIPILGNVQEALQALEGEVARYATVAAQNGAPNFQEYLGALVKDSSRCTRVLRSDNPFRDVVDGYVTEMLQASAGRLRAWKGAETAEAEAQEIQRTHREWLQKNLLRLYDYLEEMVRTATSDGTVPRDIRVRIEDLMRSFTGSLAEMHVKEIPIQLNRDVVRPELHHVVNRTGTGQTIVKVSRAGFTLEGQVLRKAEVWVH